MSTHNKVWTAIVIAGWIALFVAARYLEQHVGWSGYPHFPLY